MVGDEVRQQDGQQLLLENMPGGLKKKGRKGGREKKREVRKGGREEVREGGKGWKEGRDYRYNLKERESNPHLALKESNEEDVGTLLHWDTEQFHYLIVVALFRKVQ